MSTIYRVKRGKLERLTPEGGHERVTEANDPVAMGLFGDMGGDLTPDGYYELDMGTREMRWERELEATEMA